MVFFMFLWVKIPMFLISPNFSKSVWTHMICIICSDSIFPLVADLLSVLLWFSFLSLNSGSPHLVIIFTLWASRVKVSSQSLALGHTYGPLWLPERQPPWSATCGATSTGLTLALSPSNFFGPSLVLEFHPSMLLSKRFTNSKVVTAAKRWPSNRLTFWTRRAVPSPSMLLWPPQFRVNLQECTSPMDVEWNVA